MKRRDPIQVFADVCCPFTHVGLRRFVERRAELGRPEVKVWVRAWPLEIVNGEPLAADFIAEEVDDIRTQCTPDLFVCFEEKPFPLSSMPAFALAAAGYRASLEAGEVISLRLRTALFEECADIADGAVLRSIGAQLGVAAQEQDAESVALDHAEGIDRGVIGSPHFFTADRLPRS